MSDMTKILIVDDDPDIRNILDLLLRRDYETAEAANGSDAVAYREKHRETDLIILGSTRAIDYTPQERAVLARYTEEGGTLIALAGAETLDHQILCAGTVRSENKISDFGKSFFLGDQACGGTVSEDGAIALVLWMEILGVCLSCQQQYILG